MIHSTNSIPEPTTFEKQLKAVIEGVTRSLTNFANSHERLSRHMREGFRDVKEDSQEQQTAMRKYMKGITENSNKDLIDEMCRQYKEINQDLLQLRRLLLCTNDQNQDN